MKAVVTQSYNTPEDRKFALEHYGPAHNFPDRECKVGDDLGAWLIADNTFELIIDKKDNLFLVEPRA